MTKLTSKAVENWKAAATRLEIPDAVMPGLYLLVQPTGRRGWAIRYRYGNRTRKYTIGAYPIFSLAQARDRAGEVLREVHKGREPTQRSAGSVSVAVEQFLNEHCKQHRTQHPTRMLLARHLVAGHGHRKLEDVTNAEIKNILRKCSGPIIANRVFAQLRTFFGWCVGEKLIPVSPMADMKRPTKKEKARERVLSDDEIKKIWKTLPEDHFGAIVRLLILTGQRRSEVTRMEWSEIRGDVWTLPGVRTKNGNPHIVPLSAQALAIINTQPRVSERYVFSLDGKRPYSGANSAKEAFTGAVGLSEHWTIHDLRRTLATGLQRLGVRLEVTESVLNHTSGSRGGIVGIYQRHDFAAEKRKALDSWANHVEQLVRL